LLDWACSQAPPAAAAGRLLHQPAALPQSWQQVFLQPAPVGHKARINCKHWILADAVFENEAGLLAVSIIIWLFITGISAATYS
jgi:hypothetical protein